MTPLFAALYTVGGICLVVGLIELVVASRVGNPSPHLAFGLTSFAAAANALIESPAYRTEIIAAYNSAFKLQVAMSILQSRLCELAGQRSQELLSLQCDLLDFGWLTR